MFGQLIWDMSRADWDAHCAKADELAKAAEQRTDHAYEADCQPSFDRPKVDKPQ